MFGLLWFAFSEKTSAARSLACCEAKKAGDPGLVRGDHDWEFFGCRVESSRRKNADWIVEVGVD